MQTSREDARRAPAELHEIAEASAARQTPAEGVDFVLLVSLRSCMATM